ncbi:tRNA lysidine(34) synthetase TilS [Fructilactobacillus frigidiflavus]|uniref:tRNA lysidine(34) synthetase TilS n=2 Tax=Fructilactobacillus frigidiflavus TaxID=3242688 RepID=UPI003757CB95
MNLATRFEQEVLQNHWWQKAQPIVVAVSTGVDSMVLLDLLQRLSQLRPNVIVAHVNHQLREQSETEEQYLRGYCQKHGLKLFVKRWNHDQLTSGMEAQARQFRYQFFADVMRQTGAQVLVTAHQQNDQAETVLMKLVRSGNLNEVTGIKPIRAFANGKLVRPLLNFSRLDIEKYATSKPLTWFEDQTNQADDVQRNRIRHHILPSLINENPSAVTHLAAFATQLQKQNYQYQQLMQQQLHVLPGFKQTENLIEANYSEKLPLDLILSQMVKALVPVQLTTAQLFEVQQLLQNHQKPQGKIQLGNGLEFQKVYQKMKIKKVQSKNKIFRETADFMVVLNHWYDLPNGNSVAIFNSEKVPKGEYQRQSYFWLTESQFPLQIRPSAATDRIKLKGGGSKRLRRVLIDQKVPNEQRKLAHSVVDNHGDVLSILGIQESSTKKAQQTNLYVLLVK